MKNTTKTSPHFNEGTLKKIALIFSAPGQEEEKERRPVAGKTGETLDILLGKLTEAQIITEKYQCRYDFRITNATQPVEYKEKTGRTQATLAEVRDEKNRERLFDEIKDIEELIICFGENARTAIEVLVTEFEWKKSIKIIKVRHLSSEAFIQIADVKTPEDRANYVFEQIKKELGE